VVVARPTRWGNPWTAEATGSRSRAVSRFREAMEARLRGRDDGLPESYPSLGEIRAELAGRDLCCWCPLGEPCHADVLLELANRPAGE
jgi:hypothetical protein